MTAARAGLPAPFHAATPRRAGPQRGFPVPGSRGRAARRDGAGAAGLGPLEHLGGVRRDQAAAAGGGAGRQVGAGGQRGQPAAGAGRVRRRGGGNRHGTGGHGDNSEPPPPQPPLPPGGARREEPLGCGGTASPQPGFPQRAGGPGPGRGWGREAFRRQSVAKVLPSQL